MSTTQSHVTYRVRVEGLLNEAYCDYEGDRYGVQTFEVKVPAGQPAEAAVLEALTRARRIFSEILRHQVQETG